MRHSRLPGAFLVFALAASAQTPGLNRDAASDPVIHVDVNLRQVDLIVTDAKGHYSVPGLGPGTYNLRVSLGGQVDNLTVLDSDGETYAKYGPAAPFPVPRLT